MLPTRTVTPAQRAQTWGAEPWTFAAARPRGWCCPRLSVPLRAGPDSPPSPGSISSGTSGTGSAANTATTTDPPADPNAAGPSKDAILARIARAKQYRQPSSAIPDSSAGAPGAAVAEATVPPVAARTSALPRIGPAKVDWGAMVGFLDAPIATERAGGNALTSYGGTAPMPSPADEAMEAAAVEERRRRFMEAPEQKDYMGMLMNSQRRDGAGSATRAADALAGVLAKPLYDSSDDAISPDLRMEEFTAAKEARLRALGGEIITADPSYNPGGNVVVRVSMGEGAGQMAGPEAAAEARRREAEVEAARCAAEEAAAAAAKAEEDARAAAAGAGAASEADDGAAATEAGEDMYIPKVPTWGIFPRPRDISKAYGGGRNLKPGQELESPQRRQERERSYAAALAAYKARAGLEVDPEEEERAARLYEEGMELFNSGQLKASYDNFEKVLAAVPVKTKYGGLATLQKAIVLDSVGQSEAAQKLYKSIANHGVAQVSKKAKQMLFSFEAMTFMKADQFSYGVKKADYDKYFRAPADRRTLYVATEEERRRDEEAMRVASLAAAAIILTPVLAVAALALQR